MFTSTKRNFAPGRRTAFGLMALMLLLAGRVFAQTNVIDFEKAEITGRWVDSWAEQGVLFTPAHAPTRS